MSFRVDVLEGARIALFSLRANRMRTVLSTIGIGIGVATLLAILGIIQGLNVSFAERLAVAGANTLYVSKYKWGSNPNEWWESRNRKNLTLKHMEAIREQATSVSGVAAYIASRETVSFLSKELSLVLAFGVTDGYATVAGFEIASGRFLNQVEDDNEVPVVVLGSEVARTLFATSNPLGASVHVNNRPYRVIGVMAPKGKVVDADFDTTIFIPLKTMMARFGMKRGMTIMAAVDSQAHMNATIDQLTGILRRARGTPPEKPDDFVINQPEQLMDTYNKLTGALYAVVAGIGLITLLVGGIGIMNIMLVSVRERTREIGVRRALGARRRTIVMQFLMEAATVSAIGGALGTALGLGVAKIIAAISPLAAAVQPLTVVSGILFSAGVGLVFGIWPAARASHLDPVEALRYE